MKKAMISQVMRDLTDEEILAQKEKVEKTLNEKGYTVVNTFFQDEFKDAELSIKNKPLFYLAKSLEIMSDCDVAYFCKGWENARGCWIEHEAAVRYGLNIMYE